jgi:Mce-associated membrane protein
MRAADVFRRRVTQGVLIGLLALLVAADIAVGVSAHRARAVESAGQAALASAKTRVPVMLSYDYTSLEGDLAIARGNAVGRFKREFDTLLREVVTPAASSKKVRTKAVVTAAGVVRKSADRVTVLLFITQTTTSGSGGAVPTVSGSRISVTMTKTSDGWFVSGLDPV